MALGRPHSPEKVWRALVEPEHLKAWFPTSIEGERATGAKLRFVFPDDEGPPMDGEMLAYEPPSLLELRWGDGETLRFELQADGDGTVLTFLDTFAEIGKAARDAAGWHGCLDLLAYVVAGKNPPSGELDRWEVLRGGYVDRFPPEASTVGPPQPT